jgi:hypothetical protein
LPENLATLQQEFYLGQTVDKVKAEFPFWKGFVSTAEI